MRLDENPFTCQREKENRKAQGFQISHNYWSLSCDIMAVKGLNHRAFRQSVQYHTMVRSKARGNVTMVGGAWGPEQSPLQES